MLQRAATNAYSWWWASHIRTKQSKWLQHNLQDMEEKVRHMLKLIDEDGDSFAKRAEMYYRKRPELISFVEEAFRAYRALAERYDHISGELHKANHTIATVFPEKVQFAMDEEEEEEEGVSLKESSSNPFNPSQDPTGLPEVPKGSLPKIFRSFKKDAEGSPRKPIKKMQPKNTITSQISKDEALEEIDKLQKGILALQTEKEFIKSSCENGLAKYWEIEKEITEMQEKVSSFQDEFNVGTVIEDNEARSLMAYKALKSCQDTLVQLQKKQEKSAEEAAVECQRINDAHRKLDALKLELFQEKRDQQNLPQREFLDGSSTQEDLNQEASGDLKQDKVESESIRSKIREYFELSSGSSINVTEMAEKIDELVTKVISLETAVSSQTALIKRLRSETDELHAHLKSLEDERAAIIKDSNDSNGKIRELEDKLRAARDLNKNFEDQRNNLQTHFTEAHCNLNLLSEKLKCVKQLDEDSKITYSSVAEGSVAVESHEKHKEQDAITTSVYPGKEEERITEDEKTITDISVNDLEEGLEAPAIGDSLSGKVQESDQPNGIGKSRLSQTVHANLHPEKQQQSTISEDTPNWQQLLINGLNDKEKILLEEYTVILRKYKEAKRELHEVEKQSRESVFEVLMQLRDVKNSNTMKDEEIQSLRQKLEVLQTSGDYTGLTKQDESKQSVFQERMAEGLTSQPCSSATVNLDKHSSNMVHGENKDAGMQNNAASTEWEEKKKIIVDEPRDFPTIEEKFRRDIDELLEENLKFWLRFSTSFNQIQKFKTETQDLRAEFLRVKENQKKHNGNTTTLHESIKSDVRPIYQHMREIQTELGVWLEQNMLLKDELKYRLSSLCVMQEEISRASKTSTRSENPEFSGYQAAKFLGEVLNMQQENNKVADELQAGLDLVNGFQLEIEKTLTTMDEDFKFSNPKNHNANVKYSLSRTRIPLRSFLFGVKAKKHKPSLFSCMSPALQKQYSDLQCDLTL